MMKGDHGPTKLLHALTCRYLLSNIHSHKKQRLYLTQPRNRLQIPTLLGGGGHRPGAASHSLYTTSSTYICELSAIQEEETRLISVVGNP